MSKSLQHIFKYLSIYISASLDISTSIDLVCKRLKHKKILSIFKEIQEKIKEGKSFKDACIVLKNEKMLDGVAWSLLSSAEHGGNISGACLSISKHLDEQSKIKSSLVGALAYPVGMFVASILMVLFLITIAFPKIIPLFKSMNAPIPATTQFLLNISSFISNWGVYVLMLSAGVLAVCSRLYYKENTFKFRVQFCILKVPIISKILLFKEYVNIASSISLLLKNNKTLEESILVAMESCVYVPIVVELNSILQNIVSGQKISAAFDLTLSKGKGHSFFSEEWIDLISVGEITGSLPQSFGDISNLHATRYKDAVQVLMRSSEPIALCCTAVVVLFIALSVVTPMYSIIQQVQGQ
ncbi:MAG: type II secretion system F family protein [Candidatus Pacebacteria bacterium]|nr:type II secretion system F family protein [Candidatus Paceibacterota bacterium]